MINLRSVGLSNLPQATQSEMKVKGLDLQLTAENKTSYSLPFFCCIQMTLQKTIMVNLFPTALSTYEMLIVYNYSKYENLHVSDCTILAHNLAKRIITKCFSTFESETAVPVGIINRMIVIGLLILSFL